MDRHYSTLELVKHDETARAPERDYDATAFELDSSTVSDTTPEVSYDSSLPEANGNEKSTNQHASSLHVTKPALKWPWMIMVLVIAAAIAVGVSVGIWRHREHSSHKSSTMISPQTPQTPKITPYPNITRAAQCILNDTSLAALSLANGDRQLFSQDNSGLIRRAIRPASNGQWSTSPYLNASAGLYFNASSSPKNYTPLAVTVSGKQISLYYVSETHIVLCSSLFLDDAWSPGPSLGDHRTVVDTRSLSITLLSENDTFDLKPGTNVSQNLALLYYENPIGKVSALLQRVCFNLSVGDLVTSWVDITSQESKSLPDGFRNIPGHGSFSNDSFSNDSFSNTLYESDASATFSTPFASIANFSGGATEVALFYSPPNASFVGSMYDVRSSGPGGFSELPAGHQNTTMQSDVAFFGSEFALQINGTQPATVIGGPEMFPNNEFPFARLASVILADQLTFLYHQINGTTFAEEQWDDSAQEWLSPEEITVSDS